MSIGCSYPWPVAARRRQLAATTGGWTGQRRLVSTLLLPSVARRAPQTEMKAPALLEITQGRHTTSGRHPRHTILGVLEVRAEGGPAPAQKALWPLNAFCGRAGRRGKRPRGGTDTTAKGIRRTTLRDRFHCGLVAMRTLAGGRLIFPSKKCATTILFP